MWQVCAASASLWSSSARSRASRRTGRTRPFLRCPAGGPNHLESAHFTVDYDGDKTAPDYVTETQAGDILAAAERAYAAYAALGYPAPLVDAISGKTGFSIIDLSATGFSSIYCDGDQDFDSNDVGTDDTAYSVGFDVFGQIALGLTPNVSNSYPDVWLIQGVKLLGLLQGAGLPRGLGRRPRPLSRCRSNCQDQNGTQACSKDGYENEGQSRWPFYEYLAERFGQTFFLEVFADANAAGDDADRSPKRPDRARNNARRRIRRLSPRSSWPAAGQPRRSTWRLRRSPERRSRPELQRATPRRRPSASITSRRATSRSTAATATASHACFAATLTIHVSIPAGVTSQPTFYWNGTGGTPVALNVSGTNATATVPWDTCTWANKGVLSLPNTSLDDERDELRRLDAHRRRHDDARDRDSAARALVHVRPGDQHRLRGCGARHRRRRAAADAGRRDRHAAARDRAVERGRLARGHARRHLARHRGGSAGCERPPLHLAEGAARTASHLVRDATS